MAGAGCVGFGGEGSTLETCTDMRPWTSIHLSIYLSTYLSTYLPIYLSIYLSIDRSDLHRHEVIDLDHPSLGTGVTLRDDLPLRPAALGPDRLVQLAQKRGQHERTAAAPDQLLRKQGNRPLFGNLLRRHRAEAVPTNVCVCI